MAVNGIALSAGTMVRLGLGFLTWLVAARLYSTSQVGVAAAAISAMLLCVQVGTLGIDLALIALIPRHRENREVLINTGITLGSVVAFGAALIVIALSAAGLHSLRVIAESGLYASVFLLLVLFASAWWILDQTSVALRRSDHVLIRAIAAAATTLTGVAAFGLAGWTTAAAILGSWVLAALVACMIGFVQLARAPNCFTFRPRLPRWLIRRLLVVGLPNFALTAADNAPGLILPIVAAQALSARAAAFWYVVWMMSLATYTIPFAFGLNLFAEAAGAPSELRRHVHEAVRVAAPLASAATVALVALGPLVLSILGSAYAAHAATSARIMAFAAVPMVIIKVYLAVCRATGRMFEGTAVAAIIGVLAIGIAGSLAGSLGLPGIAAAWLGVQLLGAAASALRLRALLRVHPVRVADVRSLAAAEHVSLP